MSFTLTLIIGLWVFSVFAFAKWRFKVVLEKGVPFHSALSDWATMLYLEVTGLLILLLIFNIVNLDLLQ